MSQLLTIIWLKWTLLRNSFRSSKAVVNQVATALGMLLAFVVGLIVAVGLGIASYLISRPNTLSQMFRQAAADGEAVPTPELIFFSIVAFLYLMWATLPLSIGSSKQFDAGKLLMYPISLRKLFALDFFTEITTLQSVFGIPAIFAMCLGAGLGSGDLWLTLLSFFPISLFGIALSKFLSTSIGSLVRRKRGRGETIIALVGAIAGLAGALGAQVGPLLVRHADSLTVLRWTPPGAAAYLIIGPQQIIPWAVAFITLSVYAAGLIVGTYWIARRAALGLGGKRTAKAVRNEIEKQPTYSGWQLPLLSPELSAIVEKELRYAMRNAQVRMLALMPFVLIIIRLANSRRFDSSLQAGGSAANTFMAYGSGLMSTGGVLYVFLILTGLSCNQFAFEEGGMRTFILAPIARRKILIGKNIAVTVLAFVFCALLLAVNGIVFGDISVLALLFAGLSFIVFAVFISVMGNWFSTRFPKRMQYGKRQNISGVAGLLLIPMIGLMGVPPLLAVFAGWYTRSHLVEYATLAMFAALSLVFYFLIIGAQGRSLERREIEILEAVREPVDE